MYDFEDLKNATESSVKRLDILNINKKENFFNIPEINTKRKTRSQEGADNIPYLEDLVEVKFEKGLKGFKYKTSFNGQFKSCNFLKRNVDISSELLETPLKNCPRGISSTKKKILEKLVCKMPPNRREFWLKMPENPNSKDLLNNADKIDIIIDVTIFFFFLDIYVQLWWNLLSI